MNKPDTKLKDFIHVERGVIPSDICEFIIKDVETRSWQPHFWSNAYGKSIEKVYNRELDIQFFNEKLQELLSPFILECGKLYNRQYSYSNAQQIMYTFGNIRFNRYAPGQIMRQHIDHIHDIFDGKVKGVPVLSFILNFNDDYEGADLYFWEDTVVKLGKGDIVMFPSNFLFPHGVTEATKGKRYSGVTWAW
tara:strand:- start:41 stop:616 length:576 start_codon:yes stop_codon:yes gene_type:complete